MSLYTVQRKAKDGMTQELIMCRGEYLMVTNETEQQF
jgi:hypothetical protein